MTQVLCEWWCWCRMGTSAHYHRYLTDGTSVITYPKLPKMEGK